MIIADSGFWIALADKKDKYHQVAENAAKTLDEILITTTPVITEVCHILLSRQGIRAQLSFMQMYQLGAFEVFELQNKYMIQKNSIINCFTAYFGGALLVFLHLD